MKLTPQDLFNIQITPFKPYSEPESRKFMNLVKRGDFNEVWFKIITNKYLIYVFDNTMQTAMHWAAKWNFTEILHLLLEKGANVNAMDVGQWTPLFLAAKHGHLEAVKILLGGKANPKLWTYTK